MSDTASTEDLDTRVHAIKARLREARAEMNAAGAEVKRFWAEYGKVYGPLEKKKSGRPSIWKGHDGGFLVHMVEDYLAENLEEVRTRERRDPEDTRPVKRITTSQAIRCALKNIPWLRKKIGHLDDRTLQARYQMAANYWSQARRNAVWRKHSKARRRWTNAIDEVGHLCDLLDVLDPLPPPA